MATFLQLYQETAANFSTTVTARAKTWVNFAYHEFLTNRRWSFLETTSAAVALVAGQQAYVLSGTTPVVADYAGMISVTMEITASGARHKLWEADAQTFEALTAHSRQNAVPAIFSVQGGTADANAAAVLAGGRTNLVVWPLPLATAGNGVNLFIRYDRSAAGIELSADTDIPIMPAQHHAALVEGATAWGMRSYNQTQEAAFWQGLFDQRVAKAVREDMAYRNRDSQRLQQVQQPWIYPIQGQTPATFDPSNDPLPVPSG